MKNIILSISLVLLSISMQAQKSFRISFTDSIVSIVERDGKEESLILNLDSYYYIKRSPSNYYFVSGNYSKMLPYNQIDSIVFASTPWVITSDSALNDTIIGYLSSVHSGSGGSIDTTSLSNRINLKLDKSDTTKYLGLSRSANTIGGTIRFPYISAPSGVSNTTSIFADATGRLAWRNGTGFLRTFDATTITADRVYTLPDATTTLAGLSISNAFTPPTLTGSSATSALSISQTWNTTGNPSLIFANVTNTASGASANLMDLQAGGNSQFRINKTGTITINGPINNVNTGIIQIGGAGITSANSYFNTISESVGIGISSINASAKLQVESTSKGFLPPRMTTAQKNAIASPSAGLMVYDTTLNQMSYYNGTAWVNF